MPRRSSFRLARKLLPYVTNTPQETHISVLCCSARASANYSIQRIADEAVRPQIRILRLLCCCRHAGRSDAC